MKITLLGIRGAYISLSNNLDVVINYVDAHGDSVDIILSRAQFELLNEKVMSLEPGSYEWFSIPDREESWKTMLDRDEGR